MKPQGHNPPPVDEVIRPIVTPAPPPQEALRIVGDIAALRLGPRDALAVRLPVHTPLRTQDRILRTLRTILPNRVIIYGPDIELSVINPQGETDEPTNL